MNKYTKILLKILQGNADANIPFDEVCALLKHLGFEQRIRGSHHIFRKEGLEEKPNLQREGRNAKPYQVRQVRSIILRYHLHKEEGI